jgi:hypothetical protein
MKMQAINIFLITTHFPPKKGGVENNNLQYLDFCENQENIQLTVLTYENRQKVKFQDYWRRSKVIRIRIPASLLEFMSGLKSVSRLNSPLKKFLYICLHNYFIIKGGIVHFGEILKADKILANGALVESFASLMLSTLARKKYAVRWHTDLSGIFTNAISRLCLDRASAVAFNGEDIKEKFSAAERLNNRSFVAKQGVNVAIFRHVSQKKSRTVLNLPQRKFIILFACALNEVKFCDLIVDLAPTLFQNDSDFFQIFP